MEHAVNYTEQAIALIPRSWLQIDDEWEIISAKPFNSSVALTIRRDITPELRIREAEEWAKEYTAEDWKRYFDNYVIEGDKYGPHSMTVDGNQTPAA